MSELPTIEIPCPLCARKEFRVVVKTRDFVYSIPGLTQFVQCLGCQHIYINPRPADHALMDCYPREYEPHTSAETSQSAESNHPGESSSPSSRGRLRSMLGRIPFLKSSLIWLGQQNATVVPEPSAEGPNRLLEVGCADGRYLLAASEAGWSVDGLEPAEAAAQQARNLGFDVAVTTLASVDISDGDREAIVAWMVLEHVPDPLEFLEAAQRILVPGGFFCVSVPNGGFERRLFGKYWLGYDGSRHLQVFTAARLKALLEQTGFESVQVTHQSCIRYWWGSLAAWGMEKFPNATWPKRWMNYFISGLPRWMTLVSLVPQKLLSLLRLSGRITVSARKPSHRPAQAQDSGN